MTQLTSPVTEKSNGSEVQVNNENTHLEFDCEEALSASGCGRFNAYVVLIAIFTGLICVFEGRVMPYVVPAAQCDLGLGIKEKAVLNAVPSAGMMLTSFLWGSLGDTFGRRKLIICMCIMDFCFMLVAASSQSFAVLLTFRLLGGMASSGVYPSLASYLTEVHVAKHRAVVQLLLGSVYGLGDILLPLFALLILTNRENLFTFEAIVFHPWNLYLLVCCIPPLIGGIGFMWLPESPKYLVSKKEHDKALKSFQSIYTINTKNPVADYPIKDIRHSLPLDDKNDIQRTTISKNRVQFSPILQKKHFKNLIISVSAQFLIFLCLNSVMLWLPQILQEMSIHQQHHNNTATVCETLYDLRDLTGVGEGCQNDLSKNTKIYIFCMIVASNTILVFAVSGFVVNRIGKKKLLYFLGITSAIASLLLIYAQDFFMTLVLSSIICSFGNIAFNALVAIVTDLFPTNLRATSVSLLMTTGRLGGSLGAFVFPVLLTYGCEPSLLFISYCSLIWVFLVYLLPNDAAVS
ncbi:synaptic vesicle glycoprotein 2B-like isoform X1 [Diabrotica virgifera virgifera]|uniref:Major facilitator superfamily (MFS) profile domain-containing protein n=1 Tax=Diabrotica virgifera virgifera TaxID=50390 RepID=A0ABM5L4I6_DIAVI|nr:synaptic vesicle glycoprotein 2B-like isoform X1 [Diabrotica virgifera virgifera]